MINDDLIFKYSRLGYIKVSRLLNMRDKELHFESYSYLLILSEKKIILHAKPTPGSMFAGVWEGIKSIIKDKKPISPKHVAQHREAICNTCPYKSGKICKACGCYTAAKIKVLSAKCPLSKW